MGLRNSLAILRRVRDWQLEYGQKDGVNVAYSGGKDSMIVMELCLRVWGADKIRGFYLYVFKDLPMDQRLIARAERAYGVKIDQLVSPFAQGAMQGGYLTARRFKFRRKLKMKDTEQVMRLRTGYHWFAYGHRMVESIERRGMLNRSEGFMPEFGKVYPIYDWKTSEAYEYLSGRRGIEFPTPLSGWDTNGVGLTSECLETLKEKFPEDYAVVQRHYPHVDAKVMRQRLRAIEASNKQAMIQGENDAGENHEEDGE